MELEIGIVCGRCESYAALGTTTCPSCSNGLALGTARSSATTRAAVSVEDTKAPLTMREPPKFVEAPASNGRARGASPPLAGRTTFDFAKPEAVNGSLPPVSSRAGRPAPPPVPSVKSSSKPKSLSLEELMDQAKNFVCRSCSTPVPIGHKFCGRCGAAVPPEIMNARTQFFGQLQAPGKAKLILIRGEGVEGLSYQLNAEQHVVGKAGQLVFPDDPFVSPRHANFFYRNGALCVRDEGSLNGVYLRVRGSVEISPEDHFLAGEQVFRVDAQPKLNDQPGPDGTYFYSSPKHPSPFRITQVLQGGAHGMTVCARASSLQIGREGGDLNFPTDLYMSGSHCKIEESSGKLVLTDLSSRNGTYVRLKAERELGHGDYLFIGRKLLRVEITAA
jgi:pSer/pThr/pTyr-binding forkhead associated (FHA) protein